MRETSDASRTAGPTRDRDGYMPIRGYAAIGDGRTVALVATDGSIDWLALPNLDSPSVFGALLDASRGGRFSLEPALPYETMRRYVPDTNVLETTFVTEVGTVRVTDALLLDGPGLAPLRELVRVVDGVDGTVPMSWSVEPRFGYAAARTSIVVRNGVPIASSGPDAIGIVSFDLGRPDVADGRISGGAEVRAGSTGMLVLSAASQEPVVVPSRDEALGRLDRTRDAWSSWSAARPFAGPFRDAVVRSGLALRLLVFSPSGAIAGAATTSLPEQIGGLRNWDYRFSWVRDAAASLEALIALDCPVEAEAYFWWLMNASQLSRPNLRVLYRLNGGTQARERTLDLAGYRRSRPVRAGNAAIDQLQLDIYGDLLHCSWLYAEAVGELDRDLGNRLARIADLVCEIWRMPDSGIWEVRSEPRHYTQSKMMCWVALDRAIALAASSRVPSDRVDRWTRERDAIEAFVEERCWSDRLHSYVRSDGSEDLDASVLHASTLGYGEPAGERVLGTMAAIDRHLRNGPLVMRYVADDGLPGEEGAFLACSFWLVDAWARAGRVDEAEQLLDRLVAMANDVGLYAEEVDPDGGAFLGNFPQALPHLALIGAATAIEEARRGRT